MKDIVADKIISFLKSNNFIYKKNDNLVSFNVSHFQKSITIYYQKDMFFIDKKDYKGQPHIILHWNPIKQNKNHDFQKYGLCLTMNNSDRRDHKLSLTGKIQRIKEICFELWDDPIQERFNEINVTYQTQEEKVFYINYNEEILIDPLWLFLLGIENDKKFLFKKIKLEFTGETKNDFFNFLDKNISNKQYALIYIKYKNQVKKIFLKDNFWNTKTLYKLNDFSPQSFWKRIGETKQERKAIIVGLGSIGGLVLDFLCKSNFQEITIYDSDKMDVVNNPRHVLGINRFWIGINKAIYMKDHYSELFPMINIIEKSIFFEYNTQINENVIIFNTTGGSHNQLQQNFLKMFESNKNINFTIVNLSIEPFGAAVHGVVINNVKPNHELNNFILDERYIITNQKDFRKNFDGCFTPTLPYGFAPLQISIPWLLTSMLKNNFQNNHYTIPFLSIIDIKKSNLNKNLSNKIDPYRIGLKIWKK